MFNEKRFKYKLLRLKQIFIQLMISFFESTDLKSRFEINKRKGDTKPHPHPNCNCHLRDLRGHWQYENRAMPKA